MTRQDEDSKTLHLDDHVKDSIGSTQISRAEPQDAEEKAPIPTSPLERKKAILAAQEKARQETRSIQTSTPDTVISQSNSANASSSVPQVSSSPIAPRNDLITSAVSFLSSPNVKSHSREKRVAFLQTKGLTSDEIDLAFKLANEDASAAVPVTLPSNQVAAPTQTFLQAESIIPIQDPIHLPMVVNSSRPPSFPIARILAFVGVSGAAVASLVYLTLKSIWKRVSLFLSHYKDQLGLRLAFVLKYSKHMLKFASNYTALPSTKDTLQDDNKIIDSPPLTFVLQRRSDILQSHVSDLKSRLESLKEKRLARTEILKQLRIELNSFSDQVTLHLFGNPSSVFGTYSGYGKDSYSTETPSLQSVKSDIRSLKGILLSRRPRLASVEQ